MKLRSRYLVVLGLDSRTGEFQEFAVLDDALTWIADQFLTTEAVGPGRVYEINPDDNVSMFLTELQR